MQITDKVKIGGYMYDILRPAEPFISNQIVADGEHDFVNQTIKVASNGNDAYQNLVFLHEICHGIKHYYCEGIDLNNEEQFVEQFSKGLYQVIADNPDIFAINKQE